MDWQDHFGAELGAPARRPRQVIDLEPEEHAVAVRLRRRVSDRAVVVLDVPGVELRIKPSLPYCVRWRVGFLELESFVLRAAVRVALATEEALVPAAARFDVPARDEGLRSHGCS